MKHRLILTCCAVSLAAIFAFKKKEPQQNVVLTASKPPKAIDLANFDKSVKPGDDFYQYVNGNWLKNNPLPASETRWGSFNVLDDITRHRVLTILDETAKQKDAPEGNIWG